MRSIVRHRPAPTLSDRPSPASGGALRLRSQLRKWRGSSSTATATTASSPSPRSPGALAQRRGSGSVVVGHDALLPTPTRSAKRRLSRTGSSGSALWAAGSDPFLAGEPVNAVLRQVSPFYAMGRCACAGWPWSLFGARCSRCRTTSSRNAHHTQLFAVLVPVMVLLLHEALVRVPASCSVMRDSRCGARRGGVLRGVAHDRVLHGVVLRVLHARDRDDRRVMVGLPGRGIVARWARALRLLAVVAAQVLGCCSRPRVALPPRARRACTPTRWRSRSHRTCSTCDQRRLVPPGWFRARCRRGARRVVELAATERAGIPTRMVIAVHRRLRVARARLPKRRRADARHRARCGGQRRRGRWRRGSATSSWWLQTTWCRGQAARAVTRIQIFLAAPIVVVVV